LKAALTEYDRYSGLGEAAITDMGVIYAALSDFDGACAQEQSTTTTSIQIQVENPRTSRLEIQDVGWRNAVLTRWRNLPESRARGQCAEREEQRAEQTCNHNLHPRSAVIELDPKPAFGNTY